MKENSIKDIIEEKYTRYLNCETDIIELTLEEAKFILETGERRNYVTSILQEAGKVLLSDYKRVLKKNKELNEKWDKDTHKLQNDLDIANAKIIELLKENEELKVELERQKDINTIINQKRIDKNYEKALEKSMLKFLKTNMAKDFVSVQKVKDIIDRIDYDIKKTKEIISKNTNIHATYRKNDYQIVRLRAMNTKSLDIKKRLQKLLESEE